MPDHFKVAVTREYTFATGYGVSITPVWSGEDETCEHVADIDVQVVAINSGQVQVIGGVPCVPLGGDMFVPIENFERVEDLAYDDTHDLRDRWFPSLDAAEAHARGVRDAWEHPLPWVSFIAL